MDACMNITKKKATFLILIGTGVCIILGYLFFPFFYSHNGVSFSFNDFPFRIPDRIRNLESTGIICWRHCNSSSYGFVECIAKVDESDMKSLIDEYKGEGTFDRLKNLVHLPYRSSELFPECDKTFRPCFQLSDNSNRNWLDIYYDFNRNIIFISSTIQDKRNR